jgi:hypothetical protein
MKIILVRYLGAGRVLGEQVPAVITNRTIARINAAHGQGIALWRSILLDGAPPHTAVAKMHSNLISMGLSFSNERWMTPVLHGHYSTWRANPPRPRSRLEYGPHWRLKFDRVKQFSQVYYLTTQMLRERRPRSLAYVWYGQPGQGVDLFHQRLTVELGEKLSDVSLYEVQPEWPMAFDNPMRACEAMLTQAFDVNTLDDIPARIRTQSREVSGRQTLVHVRHRPVESPKRFNPAMLKEYLEWWDNCFAPLLEGQVFAVLGVSFIVGKPIIFHKVLTERARILKVHFIRTVLQVLDEMEQVSRKDLLDFLHTHNVLLPLSHRDRVLDDILARTQGDYDMTLEALKDIAARAWAHGDDRPGLQEPAVDDEDYN